MLQHIKNLEILIEPQSTSKNWFGLEKNSITFTYHLHIIYITFTYPNRKNSSKATFGLVYEKVFASTSN